jgi:hypothetical protein
LAGICWVRNALIANVFLGIWGGFEGSARRLGLAGSISSTVGSGGSILLLLRLFIGLG